MAQSLDPSLVSMLESLTSQAASNPSKSPDPLFTPGLPFEERQRRILKLAATCINLGQILRGDLRLASEHGPDAYEGKNLDVIRALVAMAVLQILNETKTAFE
jgi:hypothetical protein